jgi:hypothetical protein
MQKNLFLPYPERQSGAENKTIHDSVGHFNRWIADHVDRLREGDLVSFPIPFGLHPSSRQRAFHRILKQTGWHVMEKRVAQDGKLLWILKPPEAYFTYRKQRQHRILLGLAAGGLLIATIILLLLNT